MTATMNESSQPAPTDALVRRRYGAVHVRCGLAVALVALSHAGAAWGQAACDDAQIRRGYELRRDGHDGEALEQFRAASEACHTPRAQAQRGLAEAALGRWIDADQHLTEALMARSDPWITRNRGQLEAVGTQVAAHVGQLEVRGGVEGAEVLLDGRPVGTLPLREFLRVVAGTATLVARAAGYETVNRTVIITAGRLVRENLQMVPHVEAPPVRRVEIAPAPRPEPIGQLDVTPSTGGTQRALGWTAAAGAVAFLTGGVVASVVQSGAGSYLHDAANNCRGTREALTGDCLNQSDTESTAQTMSIVGYATSGALAVTAVALWLTAPSATRRSTALMGCGVGPGSTGVSCAFRF